MIEALVFLLPFGTRRILGHLGTPATEWNAVAVWMTDIVLLGLAATWLARRKATAIGAMGATAWPFFLFLAAIGFSVVWNGADPLSAFRYGKLALLAFFALAVGWSWRRGSSGKLLAIFVAVAVLESILGTFQFFSQHDAGLRILGESRLDAAASGIAKIDIGSSKLIRSYGTFPHPNVFAAYLAVALWFVWVAALRSKLPAVWLAAVFPLALAFVLTFSRGGLSAFAAGLAVSAAFAILRWRRLERGARDVSIAFFFAVLAALVIFAAIFAPFWRDRAVPSVTEGAVAQRLLYSEVALAMLADRPLAGVGLGRFSDRIAEYVEPKPLAVPSTTFPLWLMQPVHSVYLLIGAEAGIAALTAFAAYLVALGACVRRRQGAEVLPFAGIFATFVLVGAYDHFFLTINQGALLFWLVAGILMAGREKEVSTHA